MTDTEEKVIPTAEVIQKLRSNPTGNPLLDQFCTFLAGRLNDEIVPLGFVMVYFLATGDLDKGVDGFTGNPIRHKLAGQGLGRIFLAGLNAVASKVLPEDFAADVKREWKEVLAQST